QRLDAAEPESEDKSKDKDDRCIDHFFVQAARQEGAAFLVAVQEIVDDVGVDFDAHVSSVLLLKRSAAQVADAESGPADQHDLIFERFARDSAVEHIPHRIMLVGVEGSGVVDEDAAILPGLQAVTAELNTLQAVLGYISRYLLVRNFLVFADGLHSQRGEEILVAITHNQ